MTPGMCNQTTVTETLTVCGHTHWHVSTHQLGFPAAVQHSHL